jgi:hypothetical protein
VFYNFHNNFHTLTLARIRTLQYFMFCNFRCDFFFSRSHAHICKFQYVVFCNFYNNFRTHAHTCASIRTCNQVRGRVASDVDAELAKSAGGVAKIVVVVNYDMQNFEELINPEVPSAAAAHVNAMSIPSMWNTMPRSSGATFSLAGKSPFKHDEDSA